jgi:single-stranded DNA-binding protein
MALITVYGRFSVAPELKTGKSGRSYVNVSLAENGRKNQQTGERGATTWYKAVGFSDAATAQMVAVSPKDWIKVTGYPKANAFSRKDGTPGAEIEITIASVEVQPDTRTAAAAETSETAVPAGF